MRVLLLFPPTPAPSPAYFGPPYALALLGAILRRAGHTVTARDYDGLSLAAMAADLPGVLDSACPELIGISCLSVNRASAVAAVNQLKALVPDVPVIVGGPFPTLYPEIFFRRCQADMVCLGDGDETLLEVVEALEGGGALESVAGLMLRRPDARPLRTPPRPRFTALDSLPFPDLSLFDVSRRLTDYAQPTQRAAMARLQLAGRRPFVSDALLMVMSSRGCAWGCSFCPLSKWEGAVLLHSPSYVVDLLAAHVARFGQRRFVFGDNTLSYPRQRLIEICDGIVDRGLDIEWICMTRADMVDRQLLEHMAAAGCREVSYGIESLSPTVHKAMGKKLSVRRVAPAFEMTHAAGMCSTMMLMVGNEGETRQTLRETVGRARDISPDRVLIWTTKVYPGTRLWDRALREGVVPPGYLDDDEAPALDYTGEHDAAELRSLERRLRPRVTYVALPPQALAAPEASAPTERALLTAIWRGAEVVLGGQHDPLTQAALPRLITWAKAQGLRTLWLHTDAGALGSRSTRRALQAVADNILAGLIVPVLSPSEAAHDRRVGRVGALRSTRKGLLAWTRNNKTPVTVWAYLDADNVAAAGRWVSWLANHGVQRVCFIFGEDPAGWRRVPTATLPGLAEAGAAVREAAATGRACGVSVSAAGLPECVLGAGREDIPVHALGRPFDERLDPPPGGSGQPVALSRWRRARKSLVAGCSRCAVVAACEGVWTAYLDARGDRELRPCEPMAAKRSR